MLRSSRDHKSRKPCTCRKEANKPTIQQFIHRRKFTCNGNKFNKLHISSILHTSHCAVIIQ